jgi:hypothetical protein
VLLGLLRLLGQLRLLVQLEPGNRRVVKLVLQVQQVLVQLTTLLLEEEAPRWDNHPTGGGY